jgi:RecA-family ATPase
LALQLSVAVATGTLWLGTKVRIGKVLYVSAEDDLDEIHIRLKGICSAERLDVGDTAGLEIAALAGEDAVLATETVKGSSVASTPLFDRLRLKLASLRPTLLVLDNLADIFAGNENVRPLARQFIGLLRGVAIEFDCTVLLLAHPSLSGMTSGSGASGNTAWNNSVRSRLYLVRPGDAKAQETDPDQRVLRTMKANYGPAGGEIQVRWQAGRFVRTDADHDGDFDLAARAHQADRVFLHLLRWHMMKGISVSPRPSSSYAPTVFARHPQSEGVSKQRLERSMCALLDRDSIRVEQVGPPSKRRYMLVLADADG